MKKNITISSILILSLSFLVGVAHASVPALNVVSNPTNATYYNNVTKSADRLIALQNSNGSWDWIVTGATGPTTNTYYNITGVAANGLLDAYAITGNTTYLTAAEAAGGYILAAANSTTNSPDTNVATGRQNGYNIVFLNRLTQVSGNSTYSAEATQIFSNIFSSDNYWTDNNGNFCVASPTPGCTADELLAGYENYRSAPATNPDGVVAWDLEPYVEAAVSEGNTALAQQLDTDITSYITNPAYVSGINDYSLGLSSAVRADLAVGVDDSAALAALDAAQGGNGGFGTTSDGQIQATAYALMALNAANDSHASAAANYLSSNIDSSSNGWIETDGNEYSENNSEAAHALSALLPADTFYTIQDAINAAAPGDTINVATGTYLSTENIDIAKNISIIGSGIADTTLTANLSGSSWITVEAGESLTLKNLTMDGTGFTPLGGDHDSSGIAVHGSADVENVAFENIKSSDPYSTDGIVFYGGGASDQMTVKDSTFENIGRDGIYLGMAPAVATDQTSEITGNTYTGKGPGNWLDYFVTVNYGAKADISGNTISDNTGVATSDGSTSAGIAVWDDPNTQATISGNIFNDNTDSIGIAVINGGTTDPTVTIDSGNVFNGGDVGVHIQNINTTGSPIVTITSSTFAGNAEGIAVDSGLTASNITVHDSAFSDEATSDITNSGIGTIDAINNWWGSASGPGSGVSDNVTYRPWYTDAAMTTYSSDDTLSGLTDGTDTMTPTFGSATTSYTDSVPASVTSLTVTPTTNDANATVTVDGYSASTPVLLSYGSNTITINVLSQDGSTNQNYTITVTRGTANNGGTTHGDTLSTLTVSSGTLSPTFSPTVTSYSDSVANGVTTVTITPTVADPNATVTVNNGNPITLTEGATTTVPVEVSITDVNNNTHTLTYDVAIGEAPSSDDTLSGLTDGTDTMTPTFGSATTSYTDSVPASVTSLTVTPTTNDANATVTVDGYSASTPVLLSYGSNTITINVLSQDGSTNQNYTITVTRGTTGGVHGDTLNSLTVDGNVVSTLTPGPIPIYVEKVSANHRYSTILPVLNDHNAVIAVADNGGVPIVADPGGSYAVPLAYGSNSITVSVTPPDNAYANVYTVFVTRGTETGDTLDALSLSGGSLSPAFDPETFDYSQSVTNSVTSVTLTPTVTDATSTVTVNGTNASTPVNLNVGSTNKILVVVSINADNGATYTKTYTVTVTRAVADLTALNTEIGIAQAAISSSTVGDAPGQYAQASVDTLNAAIITAQAVTDIQAQSGVDAATAALTTAVSTFQAAVIPPSDLTTLAADIAAANALLPVTEGTVPGNYVVGSSATLTAAITTAQAITDADAQSVVDTADATLNSAVIAFKAAVVPPSNVSALNTEIGVAQGIVTSSTVGNTPGQYTQASVDTLTAAITAAQSVHNTDAQSVVDSAVATLTSAVSTFQNSIITLDFSTSTNPDGSLSANVANTTEASTTSNGTAVTFYIPAGTTITGPSTWDGSLSLPVSTTTYTAPSASGFTTSVVTAIEMGAGDIPITFDKGVRIVFAGQAGSLVGWSQGGTFTPITAVCSADTQAVGDALAAGADCTINSGSDLVVWTKHFTTFITYTQTAVPASGGSSGGGDSGIPWNWSPVGASPATAPAAVPTAPAPARGQVLGVTSFNFSGNLSLGSRGDSVTALQQLLTQEGFYNGPITGYFGPLTQAAVKAFQLKYGLPATGFVGPLTIAKLNSLSGGQVLGASTTATADALQAQIATLQTQLVTLLQKFAAMLQSQAAH